MKILILPGLDGTGLLLSEIKDSLASAHDVSAMRFPTDIIDYQSLKTKVEEVLPSSDYIIVAESFSGPLAVMLAAEKPKGLRGVVFVATFAKTPMTVPKFLTYLVNIAPTRSLLLMKLAQPFLMGRWATPEFTQKFSRVMEQVPASTIAGRLREVLNVNVVKQLARLNIPTIYLSASNDMVVPSRMASDFIQLQHPVFKIEGPHFLLQANAEQSAKHILDFSDQFG